ncbi:TPA: hypothetical protein QDB14_002923 [Burkholderia vietnamiensis]|nr:hypothetical protein [Burkholderia vietnamiensis]
MPLLPYTYISNGIEPNDPRHRSFGSVMRDNLRQDYGRIDEFLRERGIAPSATARYSHQRRIVDDFFQDGIVPEDEGKARALLSALVDLSQVWAVISTYSDVRKLPTNFRTALFCDPHQHLLGAASKGRDTLMEYYAGSRLKAAGCDVRRDEPDLICTFDGLEFGVAVKRFKIENLERHVRKARDQIDVARRPGLIVMDVTQSSPLMEKPFFGRVDEYRAAAWDWTEQHLFKPLRRNWKAWGLDRRKIPYVIAFHHGVCFDGMTFYKLSQMYYFCTDPVAPPSISESKMIDTLYRMVEVMRRTLPEASD